MTRTLLLLVALAQVSWVLGDCGKPAISPNVNAFIVGGNEATAHSLPWQISLQATYFGFDLGHICGGSIINDQYIVTAAHCLTNPVMGFKVVVGAHSLRRGSDYQETFVVDKVIIHESYDENDGSVGDIALLKLADKITYSDGVQPACLPKKTQVYDDDDEFLVSGWGALTEGGSSPDKLQQVIVPHFNHDKCNKIPFYAGRIPDTVICAGYPEGRKDACQGDSGGPLVTLIDDEWTLAGVVSWGIGCARRNRPGVYTDVAKYIDWIEDHTN